MSERAVMRVEFGTVEDCRRAVFFVLGEFVSNQRTRSQAAGKITAELRARGLLAGSVEQHYSAAQVAALLNRCPEYVVRLARAGEFGPVARDGGGWLIPASGVQAWLAGQTVARRERIEVAA